MLIQHNIAALNSYNKLSLNNTQVAKNIEKLSSGFKINRAADDVAGLAISEKMRAQITGLTRASQNVNDAISLVQTAEGALTEIHSMLNRMVDLATQSSNGTIDNEVDRKNLQKEVESLKGEINRIAKTTCYNNINVLQGYSSGEVLPVVFKERWRLVNTEIKGDLTFTGGTDGKYIALCGMAADNNPATITANWDGDRLDIIFKGQKGVVANMTEADLQNAINNATGTVPTTNEKITAKISNNSNIKIYDSAIDGYFNEVLMFKQSEQITGVAGDAHSLSEFGTAMLFFADAVSFSKNSSLNISNSSNGGNYAEWIEFAGHKSLKINLDRTISTTYTEEFINNLVKNALGDKPPGNDNLEIKLINGSVNLAPHPGDNTSYGLTVFTSDKDIDATKGIFNFQIGDTADQRLRYEVKGVTCGNLKITDVDISTENGAVAAIDKVKNAINIVSEIRADLGAIQNRLEHTFNNLATATENITGAESRIRDTDMAKEMMAFTKNNILSQSAQAMLAQANQQPNKVLTLLN